MIQNSDEVTANTELVITRLLCVGVGFVWDDTTLTGELSVDRNPVVVWHPNGCREIETYTNRDRWVATKALDSLEATLQLSYAAREML